MTDRPDVDQQLQHARLRTRRHWFEDGLAEMLIGIVFLALGLYLGAGEALGAAVGGSPVLDTALNLGLVAFVIVACLGGRRLIGRAKERYVYPRAGYVRYRADRKAPRWLTGLLAGGIGGMTVALIRTAPGLESWIPALEGFLIGGFLYWQSRFGGVARYAALALLSAAVGLAVSLGRFSTEVAGALFFGAIGLILLTSGQLAFRRFLRSTPPPEQS